MTQPCLLWHSLSVFLLQPPPHPILKFLTGGSYPTSPRRLYPQTPVFLQTTSIS